MFTKQLEEEIIDLPSFVPFTLVSDSSSLPLTLPFSLCSSLSVVPFWTGFSSFSSSTTSFSGTLGTSSSGTFSTSFFSTSFSGVAWVVLKNYLCKTVAYGETGCLWTSSYVILQNIGHFQYEVLKKPNGIY